MQRIFISYSSYDSDIAETLSGDLRSAGFEPWIDKQSISVGDTIIKEIESAILNCHYFIVIISQKAIQSNWVEHEIDKVMHQKFSKQRRKQIIPALIDQCDIPSRLETLKYADFRNSYTIGFAQIYAAIINPSLIVKWPENILPADQLVAMENDGGNHYDHIRFAYAHTIWSIRPDRAKRILENQLEDLSVYVKEHAKYLLDNYY